MNKTDLIKEIATNAGISQADAGKTLNALMDSIQDGLTNGNKVTLIGFGTFSTVERGERQGRNPQTGKAITIPARKVVKFKPGKALAEAVK